MNFTNKEGNRVFIEMFNNIAVRMVQEKDGTIWAVLRDVMEGMDRNHSQEIQDAKSLILELHGGCGIKSFDITSNKQNNKKARKIQEYLCIKEEAIYDVLISFKPSARKIKNNPEIYDTWISFRKFVTGLIKQYRIDHNLQVFELYEKSNQLNQMDRIKETEELLDSKIQSNNYAIINKQVNQIVADIHNLDKNIKVDNLRNMKEKGIEYRKTRVQILKEYLDIFEQRKSKSDANMLIRYKYGLEQKGKGKKVFKQVI